MPGRRHRGLRRSGGSTSFVIGPEGLADEWLPGEAVQPGPSRAEADEGSDASPTLPDQAAVDRSDGEPPQRAFRSRFALGRVAVLVLTIAWVTLGLQLVNSGRGRVEPAEPEGATKSTKSANGAGRRRARALMGRTGAGEAKRLAWASKRAPARRPRGSSPEPIPAPATPEPPAVVPDVEPAAAPSPAQAASEPNKPPPLRPGEAMLKEFGP